MEKRVSELEYWQRGTNADLYGAFGKPGLIQEMRSFFAVQKAHDKSLPWKIGLLCAGVPILYDLVKHLAGWH